MLSSSSCWEMIRVTAGCRGGEVGGGGGGKLTNQGGNCVWCQSVVIKSRIGGWTNTYTCTYTYTHTDTHRPQDINTHTVKLGPSIESSSPENNRSEGQQGMQMRPEVSVGKVEQGSPGLGDPPGRGRVRGWWRWWRRRPASGGTFVSNLPLKTHPHHPSITSQSRLST